MLTTDIIAPEGHKAWWALKTNDPSFRMAVFEDEGTPIAINVYMDYIPETSAWWGFYFTNEDITKADRFLDIWAHLETVGIAYAFDTLRVSTLYLEVRSENLAVLQWHKRYGFKVEDQHVSKNTQDHDLEVQSLDKTTFETLRAKGRFDRMRNIAVDIHPKDAGMTPEAP